MDRQKILKLIKEKEEMISNLESELKELKDTLNELSQSAKENFTLEDKLDIFMSYFRGRDDVYPVLSTSKEDPNIKFYSPACKNEWKKGICNKTMKKKCKTCQYRENVPLSKDVIKKHLYENKTIGIYPLLNDNTCYFLTFDFDDKKENKDLKNDITAFVRVCNEYEIPIAIERSRSGYGIHCWMFFKDKVKALTARKLGKLLLSKTIESCSSLSIESFDRMFPNQDFLPKGGYGNLIALPFQTEPGKKGNSIFLDESFRPQQNQWEYLANIHKLSEEEVFEAIRKLSNDTVDLTLDDNGITNEIKKKSVNIEFPKPLNVLLNDMIYIEKKRLSSQVINSLRRLATFANPEFYMKQKKRMSVYNVPLMIDCSKEDEEYLKLPRGTLENLKTLCQNNEVQLSIEDKRNEGTKIDVHFKGELRNDQKTALENISQYETGILKAPTGFGKTVVCCKLIEEKKVNTLIITEKLELLRQWKEKIKIFLDVEEVGEISGTKKNTTNVIDVASIKTIWNKGKFNDIVKNYGMIIIDECHHLAAFTYESAINTVSSKYVYGVTATPDRENGHTPIIKMQCGDIRYEVDAKKFNKELELPMKVYVCKNHLENINPDITDYILSEIYNMIMKDEKRNENIIKTVLKEFKAGKNILVLTERIEHLKFFEEKFKEITPNIFVYCGGLGKKILKKYDIRKAEIHERNENKIIIATGSYIGEGFDDSSLDSLFLTMPISGITKVTQYTGRLHRKNEDKKEISVYDYVDDNFRQTRSMFEKRKKTYKKLGYEIIGE